MSGASETYNLQSMREARKEGTRSCSHCGRSSLRCAEIGHDARLCPTCLQTPGLRARAEQQAHTRSNGRTMNDIGGDIQRHAAELPDGLTFGVPATIDYRPTPLDDIKRAEPLSDEGKARLAELGLYPKAKRTPWYQRWVDSVVGVDYAITDMDTAVCRIDDIPTPLHTSSRADAADAFFAAVKSNPWAGTVEPPDIPAPETSEPTDEQRAMAERIKAVLFPGMRVVVHHDDGSESWEGRYCGEDDDGTAAVYRAADSDLYWPEFYELEIANYQDVMPVEEADAAEVGAYDVAKRAGYRAGYTKGRSDQLTMTNEQ